MQYFKSLIVDRDTFLSTIKEISYRNQDITEAHQFGCNGIYGCYKKANHRFAKYYIIYEGDTPKCTVMLQRDGHIIFFISKDIENKVGLIRELKRLADEVVSSAGAIITKTANWYNEANRLNRLIGFKKYHILDYFTLWVKE